MKNILIFNNDLRLADNLALIHACKQGDVIPVFIYDENVQSYGQANKVWLNYALDDLDNSLNGNLLILKGNYEEILFNLIDKLKADGVYWNRCYEPKLIECFKKIKLKLKNENIVAESFNCSLLCEPMQVLKKDKTYYKVFKPFYNKVLELPMFAAQGKPKKINYYKHNLKSEKLDLLPKHNWYKNVIKNWDISEQGGSNILSSFIKKQKNCPYDDTRDIPMLNATSKLSAYLRFGQISVRQIINKVEHLEKSDGFIRQLIWRDYCYYLSFHFNGDLTKDNFNCKFNKWPWANKTEDVKAWQTGKTGVPLVDAGMRELYNTGYMHNRVRMVVGSFLVKNLNIDWRIGEQWFKDCLFDADVASNAFGWQWVAGTGCDASPYYRVFNPNIQLNKFDSTQTYVNRHIKEYGTDKYPLPIVDVQKSAANAKELYKMMK